MFLFASFGLSYNDDSKPYWSEQLDVEDDVVVDKIPMDDDEDTVESFRSLDLAY